MKTKTITEYQLQKHFDEFLDEAYGSVQVAGFNYSTSNLFKSIDPVAYRCAFLDWLDVEINEGYIKEINGFYYRA